jgi:hypothetical protein
VTTDDLNRAWIAQANADADRGVLECRVCRTKGPLDEAISMWTNGMLVFAICRRCMLVHDVVTRPTEHGIEVRAVLRRPLVLRGG